ncbi:MAG: hypothetical protein ACXAAK_09800, partial [Candidatus Thorarchaeota archaeon]
MQRKTTSALIVSILILSSIPAIFFILPMDDVQQTRDRSIPLDFNALAEVYGDQIPVVVRMD